MAGLRAHLFERLVIAVANGQQELAEGPLYVAVAAGAENGRHAVLARQRLRLGELLQGLGDGVVDTLGEVLKGAGDFLLDELAQVVLRQLVGDAGLNERLAVVVIHVDALAGLLAEIGFLELEEHRRVLG